MLCFPDPNRVIFSIFFIITTSIIGFFEFLRLKIPKIQTIYLRLFGFLLKEQEKYHVSASLPFFMSYVVLLTFFSYEIVFISSLFLIIGDPTAAYFGSKYGLFRLKNKKSLTGFIAGSISSFIAGVLFLIGIQWLEIGDKSYYIIQNNQLEIWILLIVFVAAIIAFLFELFSQSNLLDDNFTIPIPAALILSYSFSILHNQPLSNYIHSFWYTFSCQT